MKRIRRRLKAVGMVLAITAFATTAALGKQVILEGTGDPFEDTGALQEAVDNLPAGDTLHLIGHFRVMDMIKAFGFDGVVKGDGMDETTIEAVGIPFLPDGSEVQPGDPFIFYGPAILVFEMTPGTHLTVKDLTLHYPGGLNNPDQEPLGLSALLEAFNGHEAEVRFKNVRVATSDSMVNAGMASWHAQQVEPDIYVPGTGTTSIVNCQAYGMRVGAVCGSVEEGSISIIGSHFVGNFKGIQTYSPFSGTLNIKDNLVEWYVRGISVGSSKGTGNVKNNTFYHGGQIAINIGNSNGVQVKNNHIEDFEAVNPNWAAIGIGRSSDCLFEGNTINGMTGNKMAINEFKTCSNITYIGNRFVDIEPTQAAIIVRGLGTTLLNNDFLDSGIPGDPIPCIQLASPSVNAYVSQPVTLLPWGNPNPAMQILNEGTDNMIVITP